jgi:hypothetical protein
LENDLWTCCIIWFFVLLIFISEFLKNLNLIRKWQLWYVTFIFCCIQLNNQHSFGWEVLRQDQFCPNTMADRLSIFDGLGSLFRENIYVVCDNMLMIFLYYVIFVCYYFPPSFIVINDNFHFKPFVGYYSCPSNSANLCWKNPTFM